MEDARAVGGNGAGVTGDASDGLTESGTTPVGTRTAEPAHDPGPEGAFATTGPSHVTEIPGTLRTAQIPGHPRIGHGLLCLKIDHIDHFLTYVSVGDAGAVSGTGIHGDVEPHDAMPFDICQTS